MRVVVRSTVKQQFKKQEKNMSNHCSEKFQLQVKPNRKLGDLPMLHQLTFNNLSRFMLTAGFCLTTVFASQLDRPIAQATETNLNRNSLEMNGVALNGTSFNGANLNGASLNGANLSANGVDNQADQVTSSRLTTAALNQKPIQKIHLEGSQLALKIKRSD
jgi:uncharacterized protein YjbI with pentapeptide repeats